MPFLKLPILNFEFSSKFEFRVSNFLAAPSQPNVIPCANGIWLEKLIVFVCRRM